MKYAFITSMNEKYYYKCGKNMLDSCDKHLKDYPVYLYNEDFTPEHNINLLGWNLGKEYEEFINKWPKKSSVAKFAKKGFSIIHAMENINCNYLIWIDADCIIKKDITLDLLESISSDKILSSHFSVYHFVNDKEYHSCETGFFILNKTHKKFKDFKNIYKSIYVNNDISNLRRFYDGDVYGETVNRLPGPWINNLSTGRHKTPIPRSILRDYISHYKGKSLKDNFFT